MTSRAESGAGTRSLTPYLAVNDARGALEWYVQAFAAERRGDPVVMTDGRVGHAELAFGAHVLMLADEFPEMGRQGPRARGGVSQTIVLEVADVDATVERAVAHGARLLRQVADEPYGRTGVIEDPFGHRWMVETQVGQGLSSAPASAEAPSAALPRHGELGYVTLGMPDADRAREFFGDVLGWRFTSGSVEQGWQVEGIRPMAGLWGGALAPEVQLCFRVDDLDAAVRRVIANGGRAQEPTLEPYGRLVDCADDQGLQFQLWEPGPAAPLS